jgi:hypothetical protein
MGVDRLAPLSVDWLCQLLEAGSGSATPESAWAARSSPATARYRKAQIQERQREANRLHKVPDFVPVLGCAEFCG